MWMEMIDSCEAAAPHYSLFVVSDTVFLDSLREDRFLELILLAASFSFMVYNYGKQSWL